MFRFSNKNNKVKTLTSFLHKVKEFVEESFASGIVVQLVQLREKRKKEKEKLAKRFKEKRIKSIQHVRTHVHKDFDWQPNKSFVIIVTFPRFTVRRKFIETRRQLKE